MTYTNKDLVGRYYETEGYYYQLKERRDNPNFLEAWYVGNNKGPVTTYKVTSFMSSDDFNEGALSNKIRTLLDGNPFDNLSKDPDYDIY